MDPRKSCCFPANWESEVDAVAALGPEGGGDKNRTDDALSRVDAGLALCATGRSFWREGSSATGRHTDSPVATLWLTELSRVLPQYASCARPCQTPFPSRPKKRRRLFEAFVQCLRALSARPLILFFDDLHWADHATLDWLGYLADRMRDEPLLLVVPTEPTKRRPNL